MWTHIFYTELRVDPTECPIMLTEPPLTSKMQRERIAEIMFETFNVNALLVGSQRILIGRAM